MLGAPRPILHGGYTEAGNRTPGKMPVISLILWSPVDEQVVVSHS